MQDEPTSATGEVVDSAVAAPMVPRGGGAGISLILCLFVFLPGLFGLPVGDREGRFAQASRQMYESVSLPAAQRNPARHGGGLIEPRLQDRSRVGDGPLGHWIQAASAAAMSGRNPYRDSIWMYRLPSLFAAVFVVMLTRRLGEAMFDKGVGRLAAVFIAVCPLVAWEARQASADMMGLAWIAGAMWGLWGAFEERGLSARRAIGFWIAMLGGVLTTGLTALIVIGLAAAMLCFVTRRAGWLRDLRPIGSLVAIIPVGLWLYAAANRVGTGQLLSAIGRSLVWGDSTTWWPPGVHLFSMPLLFWPGSLLIATALIVAWKLGVAARRPSFTSSSTRPSLAAIHPGYLFLTAWIVPTWIVLEVLPGKSLASALPIYPALAILGARALLAAGAGVLPGLQSRLAQASTFTWLIAGAGLVLGSLGIIVVRLIVWPGSALSTAGAALISAIAGLIMFRSLAAGWQSVIKRQYVRAGLAGAAAMVVGCLIVPTIALPRCLGLSSAAMTELDRIDPSGTRPVATAGYDSDSLVFLTRGRLARIDAANASTWLTQNPTGILIRDREAPLEHVKLKELSSAAGLDTSRWRTVRLAIEELER